MTKRLALALLVVSGVGAPAWANCPSLSSRPDVSLHLTPVPATGTWIDDHRATQPPVGMAFCRVSGTIDGGIGFELWLPDRSAWNGRMLTGGVGGEAGTFDYADMRRGLKRGYATTSTDAGHRFDDKDWALDADKRRDFASRGNHRLAEVAKSLVAQAYGRRADKAYFIGCSGGGREGLKEAEAYPADYDGLVVGAAAPNQIAASMRLLWSQYVVAPRIAGVVDDRYWDLVSKAAIATCDPIDGVRDGVIGDPARCRFDPATLLCRPGGTSKCLTPSQIRAVEEVYAPLRDATGKPVDTGLLSGVRVRMSPRSDFAYSLFGRVVHGTGWDPKMLDIAADMVAARQKWPDLPNDSADLRAFRDRGGKLIHYQGWVDPWILAGQAIAFHASVAEATPGIDTFYRLFMVPGMGHCRGGGGADQFGGAGSDGIALDADHDMLTALESWVEQGRAPERIVAARLDGSGVAFSCPLCRFPKIPVYHNGVQTEAASFTCREPAP